MNPKLLCNIPDSSSHYEIEIGNDLLKTQIPYLSTLAERFAIVSDDKVAPLYGEHLKQTLIASGLHAHLFSFPGGERHKTRETKELLENRMFEQGLGRDTCVIALGGGVTTDLAGYLAATYCRGVPLVMFPTSLLGMVDASIGGKTGVNVPFGKNMLGCIYPPKKVVIDLASLKSLPKNELVNGISEIIKHGLIADEPLFKYLETHSKSFLDLDPKTVHHAVFESCRIKKEIVEQDEKENGKRRLLNFGHTIAHALELITDYSIPHGEAVAIGMLVESHISCQMGMLDQTSFNRIKKLHIAYGLPLKFPKFSASKIMDAMMMDKKSLKGKPRFVIIDAIGSSLPFDSHYCTHVDEKQIINALQWMNDDLCCH